MLGGMAFANNWGSFIRHSRIFLAPDESDGTIWIADTDLSGAPGNLSGNYFRAQPQPQVTVKTRIEVYSGNTDEADNNLRLVELAITDSEISAQDFVLETKDFERTITPPVGDPYTVNIHNPVNVTVQDSIVHSNLEMFPADSEFDVSGSSLIAGRVGKGANFSRNNGLISIGGDENFATVLDTGELFSNLVSGRINVGRGGLLSVRTDNRLSSTGFVNLRGSYKDSTNDAIAIVNTLADGYSSDDLFAGFKAGPIDDATMLIDGGDVTAEMINSYGATVIGLSGSVTGSLIENDHGRFVVDSDDGDTFSLTDSQFAGTGYVDILAGGHLQITGGPLSMSNDVVPTFLAHTGRLDITNRGSVTVEGDMTVEFRGDVSPVGNLSFQNSGDVQVQDTAYFQFSGNAIAENYGLFDINSGGVVAIVERETPLYDQSGMPIVDENDEAVTVFTSPTFAQNDGLMVVNGVLTFDEANDSSLLISGGSVNGSGSVEGDIVNSGGLVKPGNSVGTLTVTGDYTQSDIGALQIDLDATGSSFLDIGGTATIGGALRVVLDSAWWGTDPQAYPLTTGTSIAITSHADLIGEFEAVSVNLSDGSPLEDYVFRAEFSQAQITLTFEEAADPTDLVGATGVDLTPPEITAPQDINAEATGAETPVAIGMAIATDNVAVFGISNDAQATYPIGTTTVTWTARDEIGNSASAVQMVTVVDTTAPVVTAPADIKVKTNKIVTPADLGEATVTDFVGVISLTNDSPGLFAKGETIVTWTATDAAGNVGTDTQIVTAKKSGGSFSLLGLLFLFGMALGRRRWSAKSPD